MGVVVGVGVAPDRFRNLLFVWSATRPGVGGWSLGEVGDKLDLKVKADSEAPLLEVCAAAVYLHNAIE